MKQNRFERKIKRKAPRKETFKKLFVYLQKETKNSKTLKNKKLMYNNNFDGRTASFKVSEISTNFGMCNDRYFGSLEDARNYMEMNRPMAEFRFGSDFYLYRKSGNTWALVERLGKHFV